MSLSDVLASSMYYAMPSVLFGQIRKRAMEVVPFARHVGVEILDVQRGTGEARVTSRPELQNHIGTLHAAALFALAESASGVCMASTLAPVVLKLYPVVAQSTIKFFKPGRGTITAHASVVGEPDTLVAELKENGTVRFFVDVYLTDEGDAGIGEMQVDWHVSLRK